MASHSRKLIFYATSVLIDAPEPTIDDDDPTPNFLHREECGRKYALLREVRSIELVLVIFPIVAPSALLFLSQESNPPSVAEILEKAAAYCQLFESASLNYVCIEDVRETIDIPYLRVPRPPTDHLQIRNNHLIYDYQLIKVGEKISEQRKLLEENGIRKDNQAAPPRLGRFIYQHIILGPLILTKQWQRYHDCKIIGRGKVGAAFDLFYPRQRSPTRAINSSPSKPRSRQTNIDLIGNSFPCVSRSGDPPCSK